MNQAEDRDGVSRQALIDHLRTHSLRTDGPFTLRSGAVSSWYLDARRTTYDGHGAILAGTAILERLEGGVRAIGGMTMGADPLAVATALLAAQEGRELRAFSVRKEAKDHGTGGRLVGPIRAGDLVAVCDDTVTTGGAIFETLDVLAEAGIDARQVVVLVDRSGGSLEQACRERNLSYAAILRPGDLGVE
ncbi:MAG TPA: orotate phosphoribosyltransferase [Acidimicrobiia bacterium]|nr:orotate phosphoribosyltransferase [Acidimicrobiia bacterium]